MLPYNFVFLSIPASAFAYFFYLRSMIRGETKPNLVSWSIWALAPFVGIFFQLKAGAGLAVLPVSMAGFGPLLVIILALFKRNLYWKATSFDYVCGALSIFALILYAVTHNLGFSIIFAVASDFLAFFPVIKKTWRFPETENPGPYMTGILNGALSLLVITEWSFVVASFGAYLLIVNIAQVMILYRKKVTAIFA
jgi:hypothetical protein